MRACPSCGSAMAVTRTDNALSGILGVAEVEVDRCGSCGGAFLDHDEFGYLTGDMTLHRVGEPAADAPLPCAACGAAMEARVAQGVHLHACSSCSGLFFGRAAAARLLPDAPP